MQKIMCNECECVYSIRLEIITTLASPPPLTSPTADDDFHVDHSWLSLNKPVTAAPVSDVLMKTVGEDIINCGRNTVDLQTIDTVASTISFPSNQTNSVIQRFLFQTHDLTPSLELNFYKLNLINNRLTQDD